MGSTAWSHHNVSDNVHDIIRLTDLEHNIMNGPLFNRLHYVYQDSTVFFTWPAVRIQRFEHSLGCMHLAGQMFFNAIANTEAETVNSFAHQMHDALYDLIEKPGFCEGFRSPSNAEPFRKTIENAKTFIDGCLDSQEELGDLDAFSFLIPARTPRSISRTVMYLAEGVRLAGMLHDLGHPPFSHVCEHVLSTLYKTGKSDEYKSNYSARGLVANVEAYLDDRSIDETALHEVIGSRLSELAISQAIYQGKPDGDAFLFSFAAGLTAKAILNDEGVFGQLHAIVCGTVDADRMDFVQRDSKASGVGSDAMQYGRLVEGLRLMKMPDSSYVFALPTKALPTVEDFLRKRLSNYKTIVFHHRVVKSEELLEGSLCRLAVRYFESNSRTGRRSGNSPASALYILPNNVSGLWSPLAENLRNEADAVLTFSQWNDSWLLTMLREEYTKLKIDGAKGPEDELLRIRLAELLYSEKSYQTVVKRSGDCLEFRGTLRQLISEGREELDGYLDECESAIGGLRKRKDDGSVDANGIVKALRKVVDSDGSANILRIVDENYSAFKMAAESAGEAGAETFTDVFCGKVKESLAECGCGYTDVIVTRNHIKTGIGGESAQAYFYSCDGNIRSLRDLSAVGSVLEREVSDLPAFFAYVLCDKKDAQLCRSEAFFKNLANRVYHFIYECVCSSADFIQ